MDQKLPKDKLPGKPTVLIARLTPTQLKGASEPFYRGTFPIRKTLTLDDLAERAARKNLSLGRDTLAAAFHALIDEMYDATVDGFNLDLGILRSEVTVQGKFHSPYEPFDNDRHTLRVHLHPSPRLVQLVQQARVDIRSDLFGNGPLPTEASISDLPFGQTSEPVCPFNTLPAYYDQPIYLHGHHLKVEGEHPSVGITFRREEDGATLFVPRRQIVVNTSSTLCFLPKEKLGPGSWEATVVTQLNNSYHRVQSPRIGSLILTVSDDPLQV